MVGWNYTGQGQYSRYLQHINPKVTIGCEEDNYNCELNHNYRTIYVQAHIEGVW